MMLRPGPMRNLDAAKRMRDTLALHQTVLSRDELLRGRFVAINLADGSSDNTAYDSRADAMRLHGYSANHLYFQIPLERLSEHVCDSLLWYTRSVYEAGHYRPEPKIELIMPTKLEDLRNLT